MQKPKKSLVTLGTAALLSAGLLSAAPATADVPDHIPLTVTNDSGQSDIYVYVIGSQDGVGGWADADGTFRPWPSDFQSKPTPAPDASIPGPDTGESLTIQMPQLSGRVYYSYGQKLDFKLVGNGNLVQPAVQSPTDPNVSIHFNWTEYTLNDGGIWINSTQVDAFGPPYQVGVQRGDGSIASTGQLDDDGFDAVVQELESLGTPWSDLIQRDRAGNVLRVLAPGHRIDAGLFPADYYAPYVDEVWNSYRDRDLVVRPFGDQPDVVYTGRVSGDALNFTDGSGQQVASFPKPSTGSILKGDDDLSAPNDQVVGPIARTLCSGFLRSTILENPNQPDADGSRFYQHDITNEYARVIHENMVNGRAYAYSFDDVGAHESLVHDGNPQQAYIKLDPYSGHAAPIGDNGAADSPAPEQPTEPSTPEQPTAPLPTGIGRFQVPGSDLCLDVAGASTDDQTPIQVAYCSDNAAQQWERGEEGTVKALGKCLDVRSSGTVDGTVVQLYACNGTGAQDWAYDAANHTLRNTHADKCLTVDGSLQDGRNTVIRSCGGAPEQQFVL